MQNKKMNRRKFVQGAATATAASAVLGGCSTLMNSADRNPSSWVVNESEKFDFIIVGSGAGGGPLAAGLAQKNFKVLLIEAGGTGNNVLSSTPVLHAKASDDPLLNWSYFVERYDKASRNYKAETENSKYQADKKGVYYPRASGLGGCTRVNALISLYPDNQDWDRIAKDNEDRSWSSDEMFKLYNRMQKNNGGWLNLTQADPLTLAKDWYLTKMALTALDVDSKDAFFRHLSQLGKFKFDFLAENFFKNTNLGLDPNNKSYIDNKYNGVFNMPFNATDGVRKGVYEYIVETERQRPRNLFIKSETLCTRVIFDEAKTKAIGVEFIEGAHSYRADVLNQPSTSNYTRKVALAAKEVILAGGAFNTPQLLMMSGVGPAEHLASMGIPVVKDLRGVGGNLQDRYEVTVVSELKQPISIIKDCTFARNNNLAADPCWNDYFKNNKGHIYGTNGVALSLIRKSTEKQPTPDLCIFGVPGYFKGYYPNYSNDATPKKPGDPNYFTWAILKGHTKNHAGTVRLKSNDPRDTAQINFKYFSEDNGGLNEDLQAVFEGLKVARQINTQIGSDFIKREVYPGDDKKNQNDLNSWIKREAWGHHASCTSKMGLVKDPKSNPNNAVVDSKFRVHGLQNLRVVDASVFADIPGLFIMLPTLMVSEKAKDVILQQYGG